MRAKQGSFTAPTSAATDTVVSGLGFVPKALIVWATALTADGFGAGANLSFGFASGSAVGNQRATGGNLQDNVSPTNVGSAYFDGVLAIPDVGGASSLWQARLKSFDSDGFTLDWVTVQATGIIVHWLALGGSDLTNVEVGQIAEPAATGNQVITTGFQPDAVLVLGAGRTSVSVGTAIGTVVGAAVSSTARWAVGLGARDGTSMTTAVDAEKTQRTDSLLAQPFGGALLARFDFVSFDATPSFTINWLTRSTTGRLVAYLALKGGSYSVGAFDKTTSAAPVNQDITAPGFQPAAVLLQSFNNAATTSIVLDCEASIGGGDGTNEGSVWAQEKDATLNTEANASIISTKAIRLAESVSTVDSEADLTMLSNGFRLAWTTNLTSKADEIGYVAFGPAGGATLSVGGTLATAGALNRGPQKLLAGTLPEAGSLAKLTQMSRGGMLSMAGAPVLQPQTRHAGAIPSTGALVQQPQARHGGTFATSGSFTKDLQQLLSGTLTSAGDLVGQAQQLLSGTLTSAGDLAVEKTVLASFAGTLATAGSLARLPQQVLAGALTTLGSLASDARQLLSGTLTSAGAITTVKTVLQTLTATLTTTGGLVRQAQRQLSGSLGSEGLLATARTLLRSFGGTLTTSGSPLSAARQMLAGTLAGSGALATIKTVQQSLSGVLSTAGSLVKQVPRSFAGTMSTAGALTQAARQQLSGSLASSGVLAAMRTVYLSAAGALMTAGSLARQASQMLAGTLNTAGVLIKQASKLLGGLLDLAGALVAAIFGGEPARTFSAPARPLTLVATARPLTFTADARALAFMAPARPIAFDAPDRTPTFTAEAA